LFVIAQDSNHVTLLANWDNDSLPVNFRDSRFNEVWGFEYQGCEYGVIGSTLGTHVIRIPRNNHLKEVGFVAGSAQGFQVNHRDFAVYDHYLYAVGDQQPAKLQIIDFSYLPDSVHLVYESDEFFSTAHNFFIDENRGIGYACGTSSQPLTLLDLKPDPSNPEHILDYTDVNYVHDCFVRNDTAYLNCAQQGMWVVNFANNDPTLIGDLTDYPEQGYNHSGWVNSDGRYYVMADETPGMDLKLCQVSDLTDIQVLDTFNSGSAKTVYPHNPIIKDNRIFVSYYSDGLEIFDFSDPENVERVAWYDSADVEDTPDSVHYGAWGVYPLLPSGRILISDRQEGLYLFQLDLDRPVPPSELVTLFDNPGDGYIRLEFPLYDESDVPYSIIHESGKLISSGSFSGNDLCYYEGVLDITKEADGLYLIKLEIGNEEVILKYLKSTP
jgi:choice-of-anchor B domain-containing protein